MCVASHERPRAPISDFGARPWPGSASTPCSPSAGSSPRARARPPPCWPARCCSAPSAGGPRSRARWWPPTSSSPSTRRSAFVSRGGSEARQRARRASASTSAGRRALDVGASTGGFTDVLLQRGAARGGGGRRGLRRAGVDAARGPARDRARADERAASWRRRTCPFAPDLLVADVSFISLTKVLPAVLGVHGAARCDGLVMVKPQFEVGRERVGQGRRRARSAADRREALVDVARAAAGARRVGARLRVVAGCRGRRATARRSCGSAEGGRAGAVADLEAAARGGRAGVSSARSS